MNLKMYSESLFQEKPSIKSQGAFFSYKILTAIMHELFNDLVKNFTIYIVHL